jgi:hypothetical protein
VAHHLMPLIDCPECKKSVSSEAHACPYCGYPVAEKVGARTEAAAAAGAARGPRELLAEVRPSWWAYFWHWFFFFLIIPPIIAWFRRASTVLRVYRHRVTIERGIFSKCYQDYDPRDIRSIDVDQSVFNRLVGIGDITISTAATVEGAEVVRAIPDPRGVRDLILAQRGNR